MAQRCTNAGLTFGTRRTCETVVGKFNYYSHLYEVALSKEERRAAERLAQLAAQIAEERAKCSSAGARECPAVAKLEGDQRQTKKFQDAVASAQASSRASFEARVRDFIAVSSRLSTRAQMVCRVRASGKVHCASVTELLASYQPEASVLIASDINRLYRVMNLSQAPVLVNCTNGGWIATDYAAAGASGIVDFRRLVAEGRIDDLADECIGTSRGSADRGSALRGFSGISGFDRTDSLRDVCGNTIDPGASAKKLFGQLIDVEKIFHQQCGDVMAGEGESSGSEASETVRDNGDGTETVCVGSNCYVRYQDGVSNSHATQDDLNESCNSGGCSTYHSSLDKNNQPLTTTVTRHADGTKIQVMRDDHSQHYWVTTPEGTVYQMMCNGPLCSDLSTEDTWESDKQWLKYERFYEQLRKEHEGGIGECPGEGCVRCADYSEYLSQIKQDCLSWGGRTASCQKAIRTQSCCTQATGNPLTLAIPNPEGDLACSTRSSEIEESQRCERRCREATHPDCIATCKASVQLPVEMNLFENFCKYAYWEACGPGGPPPVEGLPRVGGDVPRPELASLQKWMNFPVPIPRP